MYFLDNVNHTIESSLEVKCISSNWMGFLQYDLKKSGYFLTTNNYANQLFLE